MSNISRVASFGTYDGPTDPGLPVTHDTIIGGHIPTLGGDPIPAAVQIR